MEPRILVCKECALIRESKQMPRHKSSPGLFIKHYLHKMKRGALKFMCGGHQLNRQFCEDCGKYFENEEVIKMR